MAQINITIDDNLKEQAERLFNDLGMNLPTAVDIFVRQSVRQGGIPFVITKSTDPFYNPANIRRLEHSIEQMKQGEVVTKSMDELERMADD